MAARVYATSTDYESYTGQTAPSNVDTLLRLSSRVVDTLLVGVLYDTDTDGYPTDADVTGQLQDATCAIARDAAQVGVLSGASSQQWDNVKIGNVSLSGRLSDAAGASASVSGMPVPGDALTALEGIGERVVSRP